MRERYSQHSGLIISFGWGLSRWTAASWPTGVLVILVYPCVSLCVRVHGSPTKELKVHAFRAETKRAQAQRAHPVRRTDRQINTQEAYRRRSYTEDLIDRQIDRQMRQEIYMPVYMQTYRPTFIHAYTHVYIHLYILLTRQGWERDRGRTDCRAL